MDPSFFYLKKNLKKWKRMFKTVCS